MTDKEIGWTHIDDPDYEALKKLFDNVIKLGKNIPIELLKGIEVADCHIPIVDNEEDYK